MLCVTVQTSCLPPLPFAAPFRWRFCKATFCSTSLPILVCEQFFCLIIFSIYSLFFLSPVPILAWLVGLTGQIQPFWSTSAHTSSKPRLNLVVTNGLCSLYILLFTTALQSLTSHRRWDKLFRLRVQLKFYYQCHRHAVGGLGHTSYFPIALCPTCHLLLCL